MGLTVLWLGWLSCSRPEPLPALDPLPAALAAYDSGVAALARGEATAAAAHFTEALTHDPSSAELQLWLGRSLAAAGDAPGAVRAATEALALQPGAGIALYNRACWRVQAGELEAAVVDLEAALATDEVGTLTAASDPDLAPLRAHPVWQARVPAAGLPVLLEAGPESAFLGSDWTVTLFARHLVDDPLAPRWEGPAPPGLAMRRVVEDRTVEGEEVRTSVAWTWRVEAPDEGAVGPLVVTAGGLSGRTGAVEAKLLAPPDTPTATGSPPVLPVPTAALGALAEGAPVREGERVRVRVLAGDKVTWTPRPADLVRHELRLDGQVEWVAWEATAPPGTELTVRRGRAVRFEGTVE